MEVDEAIPQNQRLDMQGRTESQLPCSTGAFVWQVNDMKRLQRFLILGSESPTYYIDERELEMENTTALMNLLRDRRGVEVVDEIKKYSVEGRAVKQKPIILALALCARKGDLATKRRAYEVLSDVCRIPTHLFLFVGFCERFSSPTTGWGRAHRNALKKWYKNKDPKKLALEITKYQKREGWSHRDVARLMHLKPEGADVRDEINAIMKYAVRGWNEVMAYYFPNDGTHRSIGQGTSGILDFLRAVETVKTNENIDEIVQLIERYNLVREHIPTPRLQSIEVWQALLKKMPMTAMLRNLGKMTSIGLLAENTSETVNICGRLRDEALLKKAKIHPFNVLVALKIYIDGHGDRGSLTWQPNEAIAEALESAFYLSFKNVQPTGKRFLLAIDVSGSMSYVGCAGTPCITPRVAAAAMSMVTARTERHHEFVAFSHEIVPLLINQGMTLDDVLVNMEQIPMGGTDCALPMLYAIDKGLLVDVFIVYTDCETKSGEIHPSEALKRYRERSKIQDAKLIVVAMTSNGFTIADPDDPGMFDMAGFDSAAPQVIKEFISW